MSRKKRVIDTFLKDGKPIQIFRYGRQFVSAETRAQMEARLKEAEAKIARQESDNARLFLELEISKARTRLAVLERMYAEKFPARGKAPEASVRGDAG